MTPTVTIDLKHYEELRRCEDLYLQKQDDRMIYHYLDEKRNVIETKYYGRDEVILDLQRQIESLQLKIGEYKISFKLDKHTPKKWYQFWK